MLAGRWGVRLHSVTISGSRARPPGVAGAHVQRDSTGPGALPTDARTSPSGRPAVAAPAAVVLKAASSIGEPLQMGAHHPCVLKLHEFGEPLGHCKGKEGGWDDIRPPLVGWEGRGRWPSDQLPPTNLAAESQTRQRGSGSSTNLRRRGRCGSGGRDGSGSGGLQAPGQRIPGHSSASTHCSTAQALH